jgi:hypothetical protein
VLVRFGKGFIETYYSQEEKGAMSLLHTPQKILSRGTDWRFLNEIKRELKG